MKSEHSIQNDIRRACNTGNTRVFLNPCGSLKDRHGRYITYGLAPGSSDLIGWHSIEINESHIGRRLAVIVSIEVKRADGKASPEQTSWLAAVTAMGGIAGVARSADEALAIISNYKPIP